MSSEGGHHIPQAVEHPRRVMHGCHRDVRSSFVTDDFDGHRHTTGGQFCRPPNRVNGKHRRDDKFVDGRHDFKCGIPDQRRHADAACRLSEESHTRVPKPTLGVGRGPLPTYVRPSDTNRRFERRCSHEHMSVNPWLSQQHQSPPIRNSSSTHQLFSHRTHIAKKRSNGDSNRSLNIDNRHFPTPNDEVSARIRRGAPPHRLGARGTRENIHARSRLPAYVVCL